MAEYQKILPIYSRYECSVAYHSELFSGRDCESNERHRDEILAVIMLTVMNWL